jgi:hypothetical protein
MSLNPITVIDQVLGEYRSYLSTEFQARDQKQRAALDAALLKAGFLALRRAEGIRLLSSFGVPPHRRSR